MGRLFRKLLLRRRSGDAARRWPAAASAAAAMALSAAVVYAADSYPNRPIRVLIGPSSEVAIRLVGEKFLQRVGQPLIVESRPGGGGEVAAKAASVADPDGYTLLYATSSYTVNTALGLATYDFVNEFSPIALFGITPFTLIVNPSLPVKSVQELIAYAKAHPGEVNCGSSGVGTPAHLACEMFNAMAGVKTVHVPYRNVNAVINGILSSDVQMTFAVSINGKSQVEAGTLRGLAVTTPKASRIAPGLPTMDSVIPGFIVTGWGSLVAPAKTPKEVVEKMNKDVMGILRDPELSSKFLITGMEPSEVTTPDEFRAFIKEDIDRWNKLIDKAGVQRGKR
jgi:tripartite-type tricarboxylate transporter receptor subunit TctC